jgi:hypothetical protein
LKQTKLAILISEKADFKISQNKESYFILIKGSIHEEVIMLEIYLQPASVHPFS